MSWNIYLQLQAYQGILGVAFSMYAYSAARYFSSFAGDVFTRRKTSTWSQVSDKAPLWSLVLILIWLTFGCL